MPAPDYYQNPTDEQEEGGEYGETPALTSNGDLKQDAMYRFETVTDVQAVIQDLKVCLLTPKGADPMRPEYGLDIFRTVEENPEFSAIGTSDAEFKVAIQEAIGPRADDRVSSIDDVIIDRAVGDRSNITVTIRLTLEEGPLAQFSFSPNVTG